MAITWGDAVADLDNVEDAVRYDRAVAQAQELNALIQSFMDAVLAAGKWPMTVRDDYERTQEPSVLNVGDDRPRIGLYPDRWWFVQMAIPGNHSSVRLEPELGHFWFGNHRNRDDLLASPDFDALMIEMDEAVKWVPRRLVAYLRVAGIPIPNHG